MKKARILLIPVFLSAALALNAQTNDFYDDEPTIPLKHSETVRIGGEVEQEMSVVLTSLPLRSIAVKETTRKGAEIAFTGAYRYDGYSLADILDKVRVKKANAKEYRRNIDLFIEVSNEAGEKAVFSWGELYYPNSPHRIILATAVARLVPSLTKDLWPLPAESKLVAGPDLITVRNIGHPSRITVKSLNVKYPLRPGGEPAFIDKMRLCLNGALKEEWARRPDNSVSYEYPTIFYGRGKGFLGTKPFIGTPLSAVLSGRTPSSAAALREGLAVIISVDGYRAVYSFSEIVNRNDHQEILLIDRKGNDGTGIFSIFPAGDFFSDRAVKGIMEINILIPGAPR